MRVVADLNFNLKNNFMQESNPVFPDSRQNYHQPDNEGLRMKPLGAENFFSPEQFKEANEWDEKKILDAIKKLNNTLSHYDPQKHIVPLIVAQMATYNYETIANSQKRRSVVIDGGLDDLTEYGLVRVLEFNAQKLSSLPEIPGLGEYTRAVARRYKTMIEIRD